MTKTNQMNNNRASWANTALQAFRMETMPNSHEEDETVFNDLLADLMHLADAHDWDFDAAIENARRVHREEIEEDGGRADYTFAE